MDESNDGIGAARGRLRIRYVVYPGPSAPARQDDAVFIDVGRELPALDPDGELVVVEVFDPDRLTHDDVCRILARIAGDAADWGLPRSSGALHGGDEMRRRMREAAP
jgi:hypothetical protein